MIQINIFGKELLQPFALQDKLLVLGARTTDKYGAMQVNLNPSEGKLVRNPKGYKTAFDKLSGKASPCVKQAQEVTLVKEIT